MAKRFNGERLARDLSEQIKDAKRDGNKQAERVARDALDRVLDMNSGGQKERK